MSAEIIQFVPRPNSERDQVSALEIAKSIAVNRGWLSPDQLIPYEAPDKDPA